MANNLDILTAEGKVTVGTEDVSGVHGQRIIGGFKKSTPTTITKAVATAGTGVVLIGSETKAVYVLLCATKASGDNTGDVMIGPTGVDKDSSRQVVLPAGAIWEYRAPAGYYIDLNELFVDADNNNDGVDGWYQPV